MQRALGVAVCLLLCTASSTASRVGGLGAWGSGARNVSRLSISGLLASSAAPHATTPAPSMGGTSRWWGGSRLGKKKKTQCDDPEFRKKLLPLIKEMPFIGLFEDIRGETKFEASGMTSAPAGGAEWLWIVFDNLHQIGRVDEQFEFKDPRNLLVGRERSEDSQFEGLAYSKKRGHFFAVEEVYDDEAHGLHPYVHEIKVAADGGSTYRTISRCPIHFVLTHENKGFEGLHLHEAGDGQTYLFGLCEGNYCVGGSQGREEGNGRVVISRHNGRAGAECGYEVLKTINVPPTAAFTDYSGMAFRGNKVAIVSQETSAMWVGSFDFDALEFSSDGTVYHFPRDVHCDIMWCNVEGIEWLDDVRFVVASDKAKSSQPFKCIAHEQRISIFSLPETDANVADARK